jgi:fructose-1,6-bisphosphatase/sedoheptulose 1,7-bisphosphatase-like protein
MTAVGQALEHAHDSRRDELISRLERRGFTVRLIASDERRDGLTAVELRRGEEIYLRVGETVEAVLAAMAGAR